jgi:hypothetical protein
MCNQLYTYRKVHRLTEQYREYGIIRHATMSSALGPVVDPKVYIPCLKNSAVNTTRTVVWLTGSENDSIFLLLFKTTF